MSCPRAESCPTPGMVWRVLAGLWSSELENRSVAPCSGNGQENHGPTA